MARAFTPEQLAHRAFFLTLGFCAAIVVAIRIILWLQP